MKGERLYQHLRFKIFQTILECNLYNLLSDLSVVFEINVFGIQKVFQILT